MFDQVLLPPEGRPSVVEARLTELLADSLPLHLDLVIPRRTVVFDGQPHGDPAARAAWLSAADPAVEPAAGPVVGPVVEPETAGWAGLLEAGASQLGRAKAAQRAQSRAAAQQARAVAGFAAARPAGALDRPDTEVGAAAAASRAARPAALTPVSEWAVDELMVALSLSAPAASALLTESIILVEQLPATLAALEAGELTPAHARMLTEVLGPVTDDAVRAAVEARLLARAAGKTVSALRAAAHRAVLRADADAAARRLAAAVRARSVRVHPGRDGMASLTATLPTPVARACYRALEAYAADCATPGDPRTKEQRMADCLADLLLRPEAGRPPVQAVLTVVASVGTLTGGDEPGEVDGQPIPAALVRELAHTLGLLPRPEPDTTPHPTADEPAGTEPAGAVARAADEPDAGAATTAGEDEAEPTPPPATDSGTDDLADDSRTAAADEPAESPDAGTAAEPATVTAEEAVAASGPADLLRLRSVTGTALAEPPRLALVDELSGQLLALASPTEIRRAATCPRPACRTGRTPCTHPPAGPGLGPPPATTGYRPTDAQQRFLRARDRRCRFPGCRTPAARCDLDHNDPYPAGPTSCDNLCCLCRHHHRLSHQAPGWTMTRLPDGGLRWTTPSGDTLTTHPPRYGTDDDLPPPPPTPPLTARERILGRPATPDEQNNDPAPF